jgi:L-2-hydroxyglutarate oxidase LhgO
VTRATHDVAIIGGGIIGLASARALLARDPALRIVILEKEAGVARHQTGHNSGVIHMGIYYKPGSLKARLAVTGAAAMKSFCGEHNIRVETCGKVIVATDERELSALAELERRGSENGVPGLRRIGQEELREIEPYAAGIAALHSPQTAIVDYGQVARVLADCLCRAGVEIRTSSRLIGGTVSDAEAVLQTSAGAITAGAVLNCAGLHADTVARLLGARTDVQVVPFRGEYYALRPQRQDLVRGLIYPVPDPAFPFLGVHFTRVIGGGVEAGPNAVPALAREGYSWTAVNLQEMRETLSHPGFRRLARTYWRTGAFEIYRSLSRAAFVRSLQRLVPAIRSQDLVRGGAGVRAQAVRTDGRLVDDFDLVRHGCAVHVLNAPSPAATASLVIGEHIAAMLADTAVAT